MILGIDPGYARIGFAIVTRESREKVVDMGLISTPSGESFPKRLHQLRQELSHLLDTHAVEECAVEKLFFTTNKKTAMDVAQARGVIVELLHERGVAVWEYGPSQIKKSVTGSASGKKEGVILMMEKLYQVSFKRSYDDAFDALAIAFTHKHRLKS